MFSKPITEIVTLLQKDNYDFLSSVDPSQMHELTVLGPDAPFYIGLKLLKRGDTARGISALMVMPEKNSMYLQKERLTTLIPLLLNNNQIDLALKILQQTGHSPQMVTQDWYRRLLTEIYFTMGIYREVCTLQKNIDITSLSVQEQGLGLFSQLALEPKNQDIINRITSFFLIGPVTETSRNLFEKIQKAQDIYLPQTITNAIRGRLFILDRSYGDALYYFNQALRRNRELFEAYPDLLADLGKAYQFSGATKEGIKLFADWEATILSGQTTSALITNNDKNKIRFMLLFFTGRMARQIKQYSDALNYFDKALPLAPDPQQRDACIWYILDTTLESDKINFIKTLETLIPIWSNPSYFDDLLDKICTSYITDHKWNELADIFTIIYQKADSPIQARYAYILARAITEGYFPLKDQFLFLGIPAGSSRSFVATELYKVAFETDKASLYYRSLASAFLGTQLQVIPEPQSIPSDAHTDTKKTKKEDVDPLMIYLSGFFTWGAADIALPYILEYKDQLTPEDIHRLAELLKSHNRWGDQIQLVSKTLFSKPNYEPTRNDYQLLYPLPFRDLMEPIAKQHKIPLEIFYGLVRTESAFIPDVKSHAGATGLTQLMLATAKDATWRIQREGGPEFSITNEKELEDPETNLFIGAWYLSYLIERTGSPLLALASYNGGMTRVRNWRSSQKSLVEDLFLETIPITETREYSRKVLAAAAIYGYLYFHMSMEAIFADIFPIQKITVEAR
ncbi:Lytic transglycosylase catalytic [Gracilinema caldarium DSM 7334]|uniref:Lytic transglycosylase catalytic n=1 Tax=Gracilinema caldarium (strain ATCC 51460 / DSM 7334 / H1) TaxID=744872 RepID=F8EWZ9_GRAC1|nr:lytic transglycosylase domain-containing protein [Gracilinema caldarium]AEJ18526.1 Lytic transglycosylase catalytic [Gracilinema caldarium DSM 7334]